LCTAASILDVDPDPNAQRRAGEPQRHGRSFADADRLPDGDVLPDTDRITQPDDSRARPVLRGR